MLPTRRSYREHKRTSNYSLALSIAAILALGILTPLMILAFLAFGDIPLWLAQLIMGVFLFSQMLSASGYIARPIDTFTGERTIFDLIYPWGHRVRPFKDRINAEFALTAVGLGVAIGISIWQVVTHAAPLACSLPFGWVFDLAFFIGNISNLAGLGNRIGRFSDNARGENFFRQDNVNYALAVLGGVVCGIILVGVVLGLHLVSGGISSAIIFGLTTVGTSASSCSYIGRVADFIFGNRTLKDLHKSVPEGKKFGDRCTKENIGTLIGVILGLSLGITLILLGIMTLPLVPVGLPKLVTGIILVTVCVSALGGAGNRIGHALDKATGKVPSVEEGPKPPKPPGGKTFGPSSRSSFFQLPPSNDDRKPEQPQNDKSYDPKLKHE